MKKSIYFKAIIIICIMYAILGIGIWVNCFCSTNYNNLHIHKGFIGDDRSMSYLGELHDKSWDYYVAYTYPLIFISLPLWSFFVGLLNSGQISYRLFDIANLYLVLVPILLLGLWVFIVDIRKKLKLLKN